MKLRSGDAGGSFTVSTAVGGDGLRVLTLRPRRSLARSIGLQIAIVAVPLVGIAAWSVQQESPGLRSALAWSALVVFAIVVFAIVRYRRTEVSVSRYGIVERGFFGRINSVAARDIASVVRLDLYRGASDETVPQLFVVGRDGRCLLRMRGAFWDCDAMDIVAGTLDVEEIIRANPSTVGELRRSDPGLLYWFERPIGG